MKNRQHNQQGFGWLIQTHMTAYPFLELKFKGGAYILELVLKDWISSVVCVNPIFRSCWMRDIETGSAPCCDKTNVKRGQWSPEEDAILKHFVEKHGTRGKWIILPHKASILSQQMWIEDHGPLKKMLYSKFLWRSMELEAIGLLFLTKPIYYCIPNFKTFIILCPEWTF